MTKVANARSEARNAAESTAEKKPARLPTPRTEESTTETQTNTTTNASPATTGNVPTAPAPAPIPLVLIAPKDKAKRPGTTSYDFYHLYPDLGVLSSIEEALKKGVRGKDISHDRDSTRRHILIGDDAVRYCKLENDEQRLAFLKNDMKIPEKRLIRWGYMPEPQPVTETQQPAPATTEPQQEPVAETQSTEDPVKEPVEA